jgi:PAS domain S-box-containing protein
LIAILLFSGALSFQNTRNLRADAAWVSQTHDVIEALQTGLGTVTDAETGQRGYLFTNDPRYLEPYRAAEARAGRAFLRLGDLMRDEPSRQPRLQTLRRLVTAKLAELKQTIDLQERDPAAARRVVQTQLGLNLMDAIRAQVEALTREEQALLAERERKSRHSFRVALGSGAVFDLLGLGMVVAFLFQLREHLRERARHDQALERHENALRESEERFRTAFEKGAIPMALVSVEGRFLRVNASFAQVLGRTEGELQERTVWDITHPEDLESSKEGLASLGQGSAKDFRMEKRYLRMDGSVIWGDMSAASVTDAAGRILYLVTHVQDITERKAAAAKLKEADRRKNEFLGTLAHELRNPLAPIRTGAHILGLRDGLDPETRMLLDMMARQSAHLARLVDDLLDVSRIEQGKVELRKERIAPGLAVSHAVEACRPLIEARSHRLTLEVAEPLPDLEADPVRFEQMLCNLINNACNCTPMGGEIQVSATREGADLVLAVRDNGIGMAKPMLAHIFDLFYQGDQTLDRPSGGLGIGLTLVKHLARLHGGSILASSDGQGKGSEFLLRMPALDTALLRPGPEQAAAPAPAGRRKHVLIVDDDRNVRITSEMLLTAMDYQVTMAATGEAGIAQAKALRPDIALIDLGMPGLNGLEVASRIRAELGRDIYLVALTGYNRECDIANTKAAGFDQHLVKSGDPRELLALLSGIG